MSASPDNVDVPAVHLIYARAGSSPELWRTYLDGESTRHADFSVDDVAVEEKRCAEHDIVFMLAMVGGRVVGGCRQEWLRPTGLGVLDEFEPFCDLDRIKQWIHDRLPEGVTYGRGLWVERASRGTPGLIEALARGARHAAAGAGARWVIATSPTHTHDLWMQHGHDVLDFVEPFSYPDERYTTNFITMDLATPLADSAIRQRFDSEADSLTWWAGPPFEVGPGVDASATSVGSSALILDPNVANDATEIERLQSDPTVEVLDTFERQSADHDALVPPPTPVDPRTDQRWIHYPWSRRLIRTLSPDPFERLRLDRNRNKITTAEQAAHRGMTVGIVGLSVGHAIAHTLALEGLVGSLRLADHDELDLSNLNRIPASLGDVGVNKAVLCARRIAEIDPYLDVQVIEEGLTTDGLDAFLDGLDLVIEECDSIDIKFEVREAARARGIPVVMETSDRGLLDVERFDLEPDRPLLHGLAGDLSAENIRSRAHADIAPYVMKIVDVKNVSPRAAASMMEIGRELSTWPQLGGDVMLGAATAASVVRRFGRGRPLASGRVHVDLEESLDALASPVDLTDVGERSPVTQEPPLVAARRDGAELGEALATAAGRAPSGGNIQPWSFHHDRAAGTFEINRDRSRSTTMDLHARASHVAIGAALFNAETVASSMSRGGRVELFPEGIDADPVVRLHLEGHSDPTLSAFADDVHTRSTNRRPAIARDLTPDEVRLLSDVVGSGPGRVVVIHDRERMTRCGDIMGTADRLRALNPRLHAEMISEMRAPGVDDLADGIDLATLGLPASELAKLDVLMRADVMAELRGWGGGGALGDPARAWVEEGSALIVITSGGPDPEHFVEAGRSVQRLWFEAEREGFGVHPISPLFLYADDVDDHRALVGAADAAACRDLATEFAAELGLESHEHGALVLRLTSGAEPAVPSQRRRVDTVLSTSGNTDSE